MSRICSLCGKTAGRANNVSHSNRKVPRHQNPNLQLMRLNGKSVKVCSTCRRTLAKKLTYKHKFFHELTRI